MAEFENFRNSEVLAERVIIEYYDYAVEQKELATGDDAKNHWVIVKFTLRNLLQKIKKRQTQSERTINYVLDRSRR